MSNRLLPLSRRTSTAKPLGRWVTATRAPIRANCFCNESILINCLSFLEMNHGGLEKTARAEIKINNGGTLSIRGCSMHSRWQEFNLSTVFLLLRKSYSRFTQCLDQDS